MATTANILFARIAFVCFAAYGCAFPLKAQELLERAVTTSTVSGGNAPQVEGILRDVVNRYKQTGPLELSGTMTQGDAVDNDELRFPPMKTTFVLTMDSPLGHKVKIDFRPYISRWEGGESPFSARYEDFYYDGAAVINYSRSTGFVSNSGEEYERVPINSLKIFEPSENHEEWLQAGYDTGFAFFTANFPFGTNEKFINLILGGGVDIDTINNDGREIAIKFKVKHLSNWNNLVVLDVEHNYALKRAECWLGDTQSSRDATNASVVEISDYAEVAEGNGCWLPKRIEFTKRRNGSIAWKKFIEYGSIKVIEDSKFQSEFNIELEPGTLVNDKRMQLTYQVGDNPEDIRARLKDFFLSPTRASESTLVTEEE